MIDRSRAGLFAGLALAFSAPAFADGSEALGAPTIPVSETGEIVLAGIGVAGGQPATFEVAVPTAGAVKQVLAYWDGTDSPGSSQGATDTIRLNGIDVVGDRIGGATNFFKKYYVSAYRADVTGLGLVGPGASSITVEGLDYTFADNGLALVVILENDGREIHAADGLDYAQTNFGSPYDTTEDVVYAIDAADGARDASVDLIVGGVAPERPSVIEVEVDGVLVVESIDALHSNLGAQIDALSLDFSVPAGATEVRVRVLSEDRGGAYTGNQEASFTWVFSGLTVDTSAGDEEPCGLPPYWWWKNWWRWDPWDTSNNLTHNVHLKSDFNDLFGTTPWESGVWWNRPLWYGFFSGWGCLGRFLNREAVAAVANADSNFGYPFSVEEVVAMYRDAVGAEEGPMTRWALAWKLFFANRLGCDI